MPKIFTDENRDEIRRKLLDKGFKMLKKGGLSAVNIDKLTEETYIAKYLLETNDFLTAIMLSKRFPINSSRRIRTCFAEKGYIGSARNWSVQDLNQKFTIYHLECNALPL